MQLPAGSAPFVRTDNAAGSWYELTKLAVLGLTLAPIRIVLWFVFVCPLYVACRIACMLLYPCEHGQIF